MKRIDSKLALLLCICSGVPAILLCMSCVAPKNYHPQKSVVEYQFPEDEDCYFTGSRAYEAFIEFTESGELYKEGVDQVQAALTLIHDLKQSHHNQVIVVVFVHGWKNNASKASGNMWGFRRILDQIAYQQPEPKAPVIGVYMAWPGASAQVGKFFTFWSRQEAAETVGDGEITDVLKKILRETKGEDYSGRSYAVLVGHSFGGLIMEKAAIRILDDLIRTSKESSISPPADLMVLLNEAAPALQARPFLLDLKQQGFEYKADDQTYPLLLSLTSEGDLATKIAFPGGQAVSSRKPKQWETYAPPDAFGLTSSQPYFHLTAANMPALQSHKIVEGIAPNALMTIPKVGGKDYSVVKIDGPNNTPYWIMQIPQVFVPDHGSVFRREVITLLRAFLVHQGVMVERPQPPCPRPKVALKEALPLPAAVRAERPTLRKAKQ